MFFESPHIAALLMRSVFAAALVAVIIGTCEAQCSSAAVLDASCCPMIETCQATPEQGCTYMTSTVTLNGARTYYEANGWGLFKDSSTDTWKYQQCSSGLTGSLAVTSSVTCPTDLPRNAWTFSGSWGSSLPASGTYFTFRCMNQPPSPPLAATGESYRPCTGSCGLNNGKGCTNCGGCSGNCCYIENLSTKLCCSGGSDDWCMEAGETWNEPMAQTAGGGKTYTTTFALVVAGTLEAFDKADFKSKLAQLLKVAETLVEIKVSAASVKVDVVVTTSDKSISSAVVAQVEEFRSSPATLSAALGVTVESITAPVTTESQGNSSTGAIIGGVVGALVLIGVASACAFMYFKKKGSSVPSTTTTAASTTTKV